MQRNRTYSAVPICFVISYEKSFMYQDIGDEVKSLHAQGFCFREIGRKLGIDGKTAKKAAES